jgi:hypothetical protein
VFTPIEWLDFNAKSPQRLAEQDEAVAKNEEMLA